MRTGAWLLVVVLGLGALGFLAVGAGTVGLLVGVVAFATLAAIGLRVVAPDDDDESSARDEEVLPVTVDGHPGVSTTSQTSAGTAVYETRIDGRTVTAAVVHTESGRAVRVATPLRVTRPGVGFRMHETAGRLVAVDGGPTDVRTGEPEDLLRRVRRTLLELETLGDLTVDDRLGTVEHVLPRLETAEGFRRQARALVDVATAVETAAEGLRDGEEAVERGRTRDGAGEDQRTEEGSGSGERTGDDAVEGGRTYGEAVEREREGG